MELHLLAPSIDNRPTSTRVNLNQPPNAFFDALIKTNRAPSTSVRPKGHPPPNYRSDIPGFYCGSEAERFHQGQLRYGALLPGDADRNKTGPHLCRPEGTIQNKGRTQET
jgi:hypothetical protein